MKKLFLILLLPTMIFAEIKLSPINPKYMDYLKNPEKYSIIPQMNKPVYQKLPEYLKDMEFPTICDLRDSGWVTPVKDQGECGACWTFATMATVESNWLMNGYGEYDLSENNLKNAIIRTGGACGSGNYFFASTYFSSARGPVMEIDDPYHPYEDGYIPLDPIYYICESHDLKRQSNYSEEELPEYIKYVKQNILKYGALCTTYYTGPYNSNKYLKINNFTTYYYSDTLTVNHGVNIIGWNDTITTEAEQKGAWLIKNSWGEDWGDSGYFYISYFDKTVNSNLFCWSGSMNWNENNYIYQHDSNGGNLYFGNGIDTIGYALLKAELQNQSITHIATRSGENCSLSIEIYDDFTNGNLTNLIATTPKENIDYKGFYTLPLDTIIKIKDKNDVFIKVQYECFYKNTTFFNGNIIPVEVAYEQMGSSGEYIISEVDTGGEWISFDGINWDNSMDSQGDLCIKVIGEYLDDTKNDEEEILPQQFALAQNYPNPFNPTTTIQYTIAERSNVQLTIFNTLGQKISTLTQGEHSSGNYQVNWNADKYPSGAYFYKLRCKSNDRKILFEKTNKMLLVK